MSVRKTSIHGNPNVGLYGYCHGEHVLVGEHLPEKERRAIEEALGGSVSRVLVAGTPMTGVFLAGNSRAILAPSILFDAEKAALEKLGLPLTIIDTRLTCLGNNLVANDHGCLANPEFTDEELARISDALGVPAKRIEIAGTDTPGACVVLNGTRGVIHRDAAPHEIEMVKATLKLDSLEPASVNLGSPYVKSGVLNNARGMLVGDASGGPEIVHLDQSLGYSGGDE